MSWQWVLSVALVIIFSGTSCFRNNRENGQESSWYIIDYEVRGTAENVDITYLHPEKGKSEVVNYELPWNVSFSIPVQNFITLYLSARAGGLNAGTVTSTIIVNRKILKTVTSSGPLANATVRDIIQGP